MNPKQKINLNLGDVNNRYYVYYHTDSNGDIFYIGKGCKNRAYSKNSRNKDWHNVVKSCKDGYGVCFVVTGITNELAMELERNLIIEAKKLEDINIVNRTLGGENGPKKMTPERKKESRSNKKSRVYCFQTGELYYNSIHASETLPVSGSKVRGCCSGELEYTKGYEFLKVENFESFKKPKIRPLVDMSSSRIEKRKEKGCKGKDYIITFLDTGKQIIVNNLTNFGKENGYKKTILVDMVRGRNTYLSKKIKIEKLNKEKSWDFQQNN